MRGDFSRQTFDPARHFAGVLQQQGRVQLDADWNEQQAIALHRVQGADRDLIGPTGAPRVEPGFRVTAAGANLQISKGHYYVEGILCVNEKDVLITTQPDLPGFTLPNADGVYLAFLEVWMRHLSVAELPELHEKALGDADTTTRLQTVCQVKLLALPTTGGAATCTGNIPEWNNFLAQQAPSSASIGKMKAQTAPEGITSDPACVLPPLAGFKGLENQLYRVEIHKGGTRDQAFFKWSRENGSIVTPIKRIAGLELSVGNVGKDEKLAFVADRWVELSDDNLELSSQHGALFKIASADPPQRKITLTGGPLPALDLNRHATIRRWDQTGGLATSEGIPLNAAEWITLEDGIQVHFDPGTYKAGDYWLIPARSAISIETGKIDWPPDPLNPSVPLALAPHGNKHHFARLGLFRRQGGQWFPLPGADDCRRIFPPLTEIRASDVSFDNTVCNFSPVAKDVQTAIDELCRTRHCTCTILITPGDDLAAAFGRLGNDHDALICFQAGDYRVGDTVVISNKGHLRLVGCGPATRLFCTRNECVLRFDNCRSVSIEHVQVDGGNTNFKNLNGSLTFLNCPAVTVQNASLSCQSFGQRRATCLTVRNTTNPASFTFARVVGCQFTVGHMQTGLLLINVSRTSVYDNILRAGARPGSKVLLDDLVYRARLRRFLLSDAIFGSVVDDTKKVTNATVTLGAHAVHFRTAPSLTTSDRHQNEWQKAVAGIAAAEVDSPQKLFGLLTTRANHALLSLSSGLPQSIRNVAGQVLSQDSAAAQQAIVIAGTKAPEVVVTNNSINDFFQGVHVGLSHEEDSAGPADSAGHVLIANNTIRLRLSTAATRERHGVFVGNFASLNIQSNQISAQRSNLTSGLRIEGIRVYGFAGARMVIKDNHLDRFDLGIAFVTKSLPAVRQWLITDNFAQNASDTVLAHRKIGQQLVSIRAQIRGVNDNVP